MVLGQALSNASPELMRHLLGTVINSLFSTEADTVCDAVRGQLSQGRVSERDGHLHRGPEGRLGTVDVAVPRLRTGSCGSEWLLGRGEWADPALVSVVATC